MKMTGFPRVGFRIVLPELHRIGNRINHPIPVLNEIKGLATYKPTICPCQYTGQM
jgi:hypothetical protein